MPGYRGHLVGGTIAWVCAMSIGASLSVISAKTFVFLLCTLLGALFPDIDTKSQGQRFFYTFLFVFYPFLIYYHYFVLCLWLSFFACVPLMVKHRGLFHAYWFNAIAVLAATIFLSACFNGCAELIWNGAFFFLLGAVSHLLLDRMSSL